MTVVSLVPRSDSPNVASQALHDKALEAGGISINQDGYTTGLDRLYNTKGIKNLITKIVNTAASNGLQYRVERTRKEFTDITTLVDADFDELLEADTIVPAAVFAFGTVTLVGVLAGDTVTINGLVYTAVAGAKANNTEFSIDGSDTVDAADLVDSITNDTRVGTLNDVTAANAAGVVTITQTVSGTTGNATTLVSSNGTRLAVSGATFSGGVNGNNITDIVDVSPASTAIRIRLRRAVAGATATLTGFTSAN